MFNVVTSVGIIMVNKALMSTHRFNFGKPIRYFFLYFFHLIFRSSYLTIILQLARQQANINRIPSTTFAEGMLLGEKYVRYYVLSLIFLLMVITLDISRLIVIDILYLLICMQICIRF